MCRVFLNAFLGHSWKHLKRDRNVHVLVASCSVTHSQTTHDQDATDCCECETGFRYLLIPHCCECETGFRYLLIPHYITKK